MPATLPETYEPFPSGGAIALPDRTLLYRSIAVTGALLIATGVVASSAIVIAACVASMLTTIVGTLVAVRRRIHGRVRGSIAGSMATAAPSTESGFHWLLQHGRDAVVLTDREGTVTHLSPVGRDLFGPGLVTGARFRALDGFGDRVGDGLEFTHALDALYADAEGQGEGEVTIGGDTTRLCGWVSDPIRDARGAVVGRGFLFHDRTPEREIAGLKTEFLSTVTHELRTPLTSVKGSLQLVLGKASALTAVDRELLDISLKNTDRLIRLINDILDISRLELGKLDLEFAPIGAVPLIEEAVAGLRAYAGGRDIALACDLEPELPAVDGDRDRLIQVLTNLVSNAVKFSAPGGRVVVRAARTADGLAIAVRDWGVGIHAKDQPRLFQRFQRLNPRSSDEPGTGLGLAISKAIVEHHGGHITVESREDEGSTFTVVLPLACDGSPADESHDAVDVVPTGRPTLLLVDDDVDLGTVLEVSLRDSFRVLRVERGVQALDVARAERPDLVLLDVVLPDLSGYDVLRILQHSEATRDVPVVMLTVQPERELAWRLGATDVVAKPIDIDELRRAIARTLRRRAAGGGLRIAVGPLLSRSAAGLVAALEAGGHAVFSASDPWELLQSVDQHEADVAVVEASSDNGTDSTVAFVRGNATTRNLPLVLLTDRPESVAARGCTSIPRSTDDLALVRAVESAARARAAA